MTMISATHALGRTYPFEVVVGVQARAGLCRSHVASTVMVNRRVGKPSFRLRQPGQELVGVAAESARISNFRRR